MLPESELVTHAGNGHAGHTNALRLLHRGAQGMVAVYQQGDRLVFEYGPYRAHVVSFPAAWHELSDDALVSIGRELTPAIGRADAMSPQAPGAYDQRLRKSITEFATLAGATQILERLRFRNR